MAFSVGYCGCSARLVPTPENPMACAAGVRCVNHVCGNGDWRVTVTTLLDMPYKQRRHAWPEVTNEHLDSMLEYVEALSLQDRVTEAKVQKEIKDTATAMAKARDEQALLATQEYSDSSLQPRPPAEDWAVDIGRG